MDLSLLIHTAILCGPLGYLKMLMALIQPQFLHWPALKSFSYFHVATYLFSMDLLVLFYDDI